MLIYLAGDARFFLRAKRDAEVLATGYGDNIGRQVELLGKLRPVRVVAIAVQKAKAVAGLFAIGRICVEKLSHQISVCGLEFAHLVGELEIEVGGEQAVALVRPGQSHLVEVLADLTRKGTQFFQLFGLVEQMLVVAAGICVGFVGLSYFLGHALVVLACSPHRYMETDQHCFVGNHFGSNLQA